jgi:putative endonuclease
MEKQPCIYILASRPNGTLYIGVTSNLIGRIYQHRQKLITGFTQRYNVSDLVWYEVHEPPSCGRNNLKTGLAWLKNG